MYCSSTRASGFVSFFTSFKFQILKLLKYMFLRYKTDLATVTLFRGPGLTGPLCSDPYAYHQLTARLSLLGDEVVIDDIDSESLEDLLDLSPGYTVAYVVRVHKTFSSDSESISFSGGSCFMAVECLSSNTESFSLARVPLDIVLERRPIPDKNTAYFGEGMNMESIHSVRKLLQSKLRKAWNGLSVERASVILEIPHRSCHIYKQIVVGQDGRFNWLPRADDLFHVIARAEEKPLWLKVKAICKDGPARLAMFIIFLDYNHDTVMINRLPRKFVMEEARVEPMTGRLLQREPNIEYI
jgi:hypothetical protein